MTAVNPFRPSSPVNPGMFVGRVGEIRRIESLLMQTRAGRPSHFIVVGERGIGKSSLLLYAQYAAQGNLMVDGSKLAFLVIYTTISSESTQLSLMRRVERDLHRRLADTDPAREFWQKAWSFLQRIETSSIKLRPEDTFDDSELMLDEFASTLAQVCERIRQPRGICTTQHDGVFILVDEADNAPASLRLGTFLKLLVERLQREHCDHVMLGLAGLPELRSVLLESHPSSLRIFDQLDLGRLSDEEVRQVVRVCLESEAGGSMAKSITPEAERMLVRLSEGYPHFIQQFGYSAFDIDVDNCIDEDDVIKGAFGRGGALDLIGDRYYRDNFYNRIQKDSYRRVLRIMADNSDEWVTKAHIRSRFSGKDSTLNNALQALRGRHIILAKEGEKGVYRLQHRGFALWIKFCTTDRDEVQQSLAQAVSNSEKQ